MEILYPRCAGLDVHKETVVACVRCVSEPAHNEVRTFSTMTNGLLELGHWLEICQLQREDIEFFTQLVADSA